jgi:hypothetical protein
MNPITHKFFIPGSVSPTTITYNAGTLYNSDADTTIVVQQKRTFNTVTFAQTVELRFARSTDLLNWTLMTNLPSSGVLNGRYTSAIYAYSSSTDFVSIPTYAQAARPVFNISSNSASYPWYTSHDAVSWTQQTDVPVTANARTIRYLKSLSAANQANVRISMNGIYSVADDVVALGRITNTTDTHYSTSTLFSHDRGVTWDVLSNFGAVSESYPSFFLGWGHYADINAATAGVLSTSSGTVKMSDTSEPYAVWHGSRSVNGVFSIEYNRPNLGHPISDTDFSGSGGVINPLDYNPVAYHETSTMKVVADSYGRLMITTDDWATKTLEDGLYSEGISRSAGIVQFIGGTGDNQFVIFCSGTVAKTTDGWATWTWDQTTLLTKILAAYTNWNNTFSVRPAFVTCTQLEDNVFAFGLGTVAVFYTTDNATTWGYVVTTTVNQTIMQIFKAPNTPDVYVKLFNTGVYSIRGTTGAWATTLGTILNSGFGGATSYNFIFYNAVDNAYYAPLSGSGGSIFKYTANANGTFPSTNPALVATPVGFTSSGTSTIMQLNQTGGRLMTLRNGIYSYTHPKNNIIQIVDSVNKTSKTFLMSTTISTLGTSASASQIGGGLTATVATGNTTNIKVFGDFWSSAYTTNGGTTWTQDNQYQTLVGTTSIPRIELKYDKSFTGSLPANMTLSSTGTGYTTDPTVTISAPTGDNPVQAVVASVSRFGNSISNIVLKNIGNGYETPPTITITGDGTGAVLPAQQPVKYIYYVDIIDPDNLLRNPYNYQFSFAIAPAQGSQITGAGTGDVSTAFIAKRTPGPMLSSFQQNFGAMPNLDLSKIIAIDSSNLTNSNVFLPDYNAVALTYNNLPKKIFIYDRDAPGRDVIKYKYIDDFFTNLPAYSRINPIARNNSGQGTLIDSSMYDPYAVTSSITSIEGKNQYDTNKTNFVTMSRSRSDGINLTVNWEYWSATYDNAADTMTLRDKIYDIVAVYPASDFVSSSLTQAQRDSWPVFAAGGVQATPSSLGTTWCVAKYYNSFVANAQVISGFELKVTTDSGATFTVVTGFPVDGVLPTWNDNEQFWTVYDGTNRIFYYATDINGPWSSVPSPTGL